MIASIEAPDGSPMITAFTLSSSLAYARQSIRRTTSSWDAAGFLRGGRLVRTGPLSTLPARPPARDDAAGRLWEKPAAFRLLDGDDCSVNPRSALVATILMQDCRDAATLRIDLDADLSVHRLQEELPLARREHLNRRLSRELHKKVGVVA
jgi:hypothetical protein